MIDRRILLAIMQNELASFTKLTNTLPSEFNTTSTYGTLVEKVNNSTSLVLGGMNTTLIKLALLAIDNNLDVFISPTKTKTTATNQTASGLVSLGNNRFMCICSTEAFIAVVENNAITTYASVTGIFSPAHCIIYDTNKVLITSATTTMILTANTDNTISKSSSLTFNTEASGNYEHIRLLQGCSTVGKFLMVGAEFTNPNYYRTGGVLTRGLTTQSYTAGSPTQSAFTYDASKLNIAQLSSTIAINQGYFYDWNGTSAAATALNTGTLASRKFLKCGASRVINYPQAGESTETKIYSYDLTAKTLTYIKSLDLQGTHAVLNAITLGDTDNIALFITKESASPYVAKFLIFNID